MFNVYYQIGLKHIADITAYDHILFIVALCAVYRLRQWREVLILVTAFTVGHSITLALAALDLIRINTDLIEFLIPLTIFLTALYNVSGTVLSPTSGPVPVKKVSVNYFKYSMALFFGLIHGMGFSSYFKSLLGSEANITLPLFAFNVGIEIGQIIIVLMILTSAFFSMEIFKFRQRSWILFVSGGTAGIALTLMFETWPY
jgi:hypothetical protein